MLWLLLLHLFIFAVIGAITWEVLEWLHEHGYLD